MSNQHRLKLRSFRISPKFFEYGFGNIILIVISEPINKVEIHHDTLNTRPINFLVKQDESGLHNHLHDWMWGGVSSNLCDVVFVYFLQGLLGLEQHGHGLS